MFTMSSKFHYFDFVRNLLKQVSGQVLYRNFILLIAVFIVLNVFWQRMRQMWETPTLSPVTWIQNRQTTIRHHRHHRRKTEESDLRRTKAPVPPTRTTAPRMMRWSNHITTSLYHTMPHLQTSDQCFVRIRRPRVTADRREQ